MSLLVGVQSVVFDFVLLGLLLGLDLWVGVCCYVLRLFVYLVRASRFCSRIWVGGVLTLVRLYCVAFTTLCMGFAEVGV